MKDVILGVWAIGIIIVWIALVVTILGCAITGYIVTVQAGNWLLLIAEAILPPLSTLHGLGHFIGFWL